MCEEIFVTLRSWPVDLTQLQSTINNGHKSRQRTTKEALSEQNRIEKKNDNQNQPYMETMVGPANRRLAHLGKNNLDC